MKRSLRGVVKHPPEWKKKFYNISTRPRGQPGTVPHPDSNGHHECLAQVGANAIKPFSPLTARQNKLECSSLASS